MGLFKGNSSQTFELTEKQILLEYGDILLAGETIEKAVKLSWEKWIFTNFRFILVLTAKKGMYELQSIPYSTIRKFVVTKKKVLAETAEFSLHLKDEPKPLCKIFKDLNLMNEICRILIKQLSNVNQQLDIPLVKLN